MNKKIDSIAIDGGAGVGKSTISKLLAKKLGWKVLETGAIYRGITASFLAKNYPLNDENFVADAVFGIKVEVKYIADVQHIFVDGIDLTAYLRSEIVENRVAIVAKVPTVRAKVRAVQREIAEKENVVVEGRDRGTVVLPNAKYKFFLVADAEIRAKRRFKQLARRGEKPNLKKIHREILKRDKLDRTREVSPLVPAKDAVVVDTSALSVEETVELLYSKIKTNQKDFSAEK